MKGAMLAAFTVALAAGGGYWIGVTGPGFGLGDRAGPEAAAAQAQRKILYYRNPMGLPDTSPTPKKDPMGMDYVPVYEGEPEEAPSAAGQIRIGTEKVQKLGVRTERASRQVLDKVVRAVGRIAPDERRVFAIAPKFEGYIERLYVNTTGQPVEKGAPLFDVYSPELVVARRQYAFFARDHASIPATAKAEHARTRQLEEAALVQMRNWDIPEDELKKALASPDDAKRTVTFRSAVGGVVTEKKAVQGMRFAPGDELYRVVDLSSVWLLADVFEQDIGLVAPGVQARVTMDAYPGRVFEGRVTYVYPTLNPATRTVPVRIELPNPNGSLKLDMFAHVELRAGGRQPVVTVPASAVIDSGTRRLVLVETGEGRFEPRAVELGQRGEDRVEVIRGVADGEPVVVAANFLIDAESNLQAAVAGFGPGGSDDTPAQADTAGAAAGGSDTLANDAAVHKAEGTVEDVDRQAGTLTLTHGPVKTLKWPGMTMDFNLANTALLDGLQPGQKVAFEFVERQPGDWVITGIAPLADTRASAAHAGHR